MEFIVAAVFDNYISAQLMMGRLQDHHINCWLKDEYTFTMLTHASGIKLMVAAPRKQRALSTINNAET